MSFTPPSLGVFETPYVCVIINRHWASHVLGRLQKMLSDRYWLGTSEEVYNAIQETEKLMLAIDKGSAKCMTPIGSIVAYGLSATPTNAPEGWLYCDGSAKAIADYEELYAVIGDAFGVATPGVSFVLPNLQGKMVLGAGAGYAFASSGGAASVALTVSQMPAHSHDISVRSNATAGGTDRVMQASGVATGVVDTGSEGAGAAHENMPPYVALSYIIRAK